MHPPAPAGGRGVTYAEFADGMRALAAATGSQDAALGISDRRLQRLLRHLDADADGLINYEDFARVCRLGVGMRETELSKRYRFLIRLVLICRWYSPRIFSCECTVSSSSLPNPQFAGLPSVRPARAPPARGAPRLDRRAARVRRTAATRERSPSDSGRRGRCGHQFGGHQPRHHGGRLWLWQGVGAVIHAAPAPCVSTHINALYLFVPLSLCRSILFV
jgi:hypothetical protein